MPGKRWAAAGALAALLMAVGCADGPRDSGGTRMQLEEREATLADSTLWLPPPILKDARSFTVVLRDNQFPIEEVKGGGANMLNFQYLPGFYQFFSKDSRRSIQDEARFRELFQSRTFGFSGAPERIGSQTSNVGGYLWRSERGGRHCIAAQIGRGYGARRNVGQSVGTPYNGILRLFHCDPSPTAIDQVEAFVRDPELVENRGAFAAEVARVQQ